ncbi:MULTISPECIES: FadR/GntR family transcriptional regulator [unclassified Brevibacterium]|uniref:FadR/GntR family transcriptional regulator n=1 Tax=unclassified Brevibacterium TaxID=2614124 RepID=UPI0010927D20|nr:FCD domain-containing protein [Brevibacterium sp. S22]TGD29794.1 FadR family transcriptional regulator [Brevibacterium sp. S22]
MARSTAARTQMSRVQRPRLYEQLTQQILAYVESEKLGPGDRLPAERDLAEDLGVSRATLSQALVALEVLGVIDVQHGTGAVLVYRPSIASVIRALREHENRIPDIVEARETLEVKLAALAAERRTDEDLDHIESALSIMEREIAESGRGEHGDELFHQAVTASAHSSVLEQLMVFIGEMVLETRLESLGQPGRPERSLQSHRRILEAIEAGDAEAAATAMEDHIEMVSDVALLRSESV